MRKLEPNYKELYESLQKEFEQYKKESIHYTIDDIIDSSDGYEISSRIAQMALEDMIANVDKNQGIDHMTFQAYLESYGDYIEEDDYEDDYEEDWDDEEKEEDIQLDDQIIM